MSTPTYSIGQTIDLGPEVVTDSAGVAQTATTKTLTVREPDGTTTTPAVTGSGGSSGYSAKFTCDQLGVHTYEWDFVLSGDHAVRTGVFYVAASALDPAAGDLTDLAAVRTFMQTPAGDVEQDAIIGQLITAASRAISTYLGREFGTSATSARRFELDARNQPAALDGSPALLDLHPYDLQTFSSLRVDPDATAATLTADTDFRLLPVTKHDGTWTAVRFYSLPGSTGASNRSRVIEITGTWGIATVPAEVQHWCTVTVATWLRRDVSAFTNVFNIDENQLERPASLPAAAIAGLSHLRRMSVA